MIESHIYKKGLPKAFYKAFKNKTDIKANIMFMFALICDTRIKWKFKDERANEELDGHIINKLLFNDGRCLVFETGGHYFNTQIAERGTIDANGRLVKARPITLDGHTYPERIIRNIVKQDKDGNITIEKPNAVIIKNNIYDFATLDLLTPFIDTLTYIWQSLQIDLSNNRVKRVIVATDPNQANVIKKEINKLIDGIDSVAVITDKNATDGLKTIEKAVSNADIKDLREVYDWLFNMLLSFIGINTISQIDKQSGMTPEEINANNSFTKLMLNSHTDFLQEACNDLNKLYNIGASIELVGIEKETKEKIIDETIQNNI